LVGTDRTGAYGYKSDEDNVEIGLKTLNIDGIPGSVVITPTATANENNLIQEETWYIVSFNNGVIRVNDTFYRYSKDLKVSVNNLIELILLNNIDYAEKMLHEVLILNTELSASTLDSLFGSINSKLNIYTQGYTLSDPLLADIPTSQHEGIFAFKRLIPGYSGSCVRLRRSSDDAEQDFGFVSADYLSDVDVAAISSWDGGSNLFVVTLYDQGTNNGLALPNFGNIVNAEQPRFYKTGGGHRGLLPYIQGNDSVLEKDTTFAINTVCHSFAGWYGLTQPLAQTVWTVGTATSSLSMRMLSNSGGLGNRLRFVKRSGANRYGNDTGIPVKTTHRMVDFANVLHVAWGSNVANVPASTDLAQGIDLENQSGSNTGDNNDYGTVAGKLRLLRGERLFTGVRSTLHEPFFFWIGLTGTISDSIKRSIEQKLISIYQVDGE
jgi:hypothetical protein